MIPYNHKFKEKLRILSLNRDRRKKVGKQGRSPTPADICTGEHLILIQSIPKTKTKSGSKLMFTSISAGVGNLLCFPTFFYDP